jgi:hypothetical protein
MTTSTKENIEKLNYNSILNKALEKVIKDYSEEKLHLQNEDDLKYYLFSECLDIMKKQGVAHPFKIYAEKWELGKKVDLV